MGKGGDRLKLISTSNMAMAVILVLILLVVGTLLAERHFMRWDFTSTSEHTLSEKTIQVLKTVKKPVSIKVFVRLAFQEAVDAEKLLSAYHYRASHITYELIDPEKSPAVARRYSIKAPNTFILEGYNSSQTVKIADEEHITNGLIRLVKSKIQKVYWLTGHGERTFSGREPESLGALQEKMSKENHEFAELNLMQGDIPGDASLVVVAAPIKPLFPEEVESLGKYLNRGGSLVVFLEPFHDGGLKNFLKGYGVEVADDIIVDKLSRVMGGDFLLPMVADYGAHALTRDFQLTSLFYVARSVERGDKKPDHMTVTSLAKTSPNSWAETDQESLDAGQVQFDEHDRQGPISLASIVELHPPLAKGKGEKSEGKKEEDHAITGKGKLVVFGDVDFASNRLFVQAGNGDFIVNAINFLVGREDLITIKKKHKPVEPLMLSRTQGKIVFWIPVVVMPLTILIIGVVVWHRRRSR
ncbi:MAG: GldG family protein [Deltaproteobacteria bacterium]|nr:GldG family protein [Deltaproteobacteria bacterium]